MGQVSNSNVEVFSERNRVPADGSPTKIYLRFSGEAPKYVTLRLSRGSFDPAGKNRTVEFAVENNEVHLQIYAPRRTGAAYLTGPGIKHRLDFIASSARQSLLQEWVPTLAIALLLALTIRGNAVASFYIPSGSMEDTLRKGDLLIADKFSYKVLPHLTGSAHDPERGDVMIFRYPGNPRLDYIKRVIGLPGDIVEVKGGKVYVNGKELAEAYIKEAPYSTWGPEQVPDDQYFVMGDNRNHSSDSRVWGYVPRKNFEGRALFVFWPPTRAKVIHNGLTGEAIPGPEAVTKNEELR
jgi:signal peptidase I